MLIEKLFIGIQLPVVGIAGLVDSKISLAEKWIFFVPFRWSEKCGENHCHLTGLILRPSEQGFTEIESPGWEYQPHVGGFPQPGGCNPGCKRNMLQARSSCESMMIGMLSDMKLERNLRSSIFTNQ